jgi:hypothetical protein
MKNISRQGAKTQSFLLFFLPFYFAGLAALREYQFFIV